MKIIILILTIILLASCTKEPKQRNYLITSKHGGIWINGTLISTSDPILQAVKEDEPIEVMTKGWTTLTISREGLTIKTLSGYNINAIVKTTLSYED